MTPKMKWLYLRGMPSINVAFRTEQGGPHKLPMHDLGHVGIDAGRCNQFKESIE